MSHKLSEMDAMQGNAFSAGGGLGRQKRSSAGQLGLRKRHPTAQPPRPGRHLSASLVGAFLCAIVAVGCRAETVRDRREDAEKPKALTPYEFSGRYRVAVLRFENKTGVVARESYLDRIQESLVSRLLESQRVRLIERGKINSLLKEHELAQKGIVDYNDAKRIGKMLSADALLSGTLAGIRSTMDETKFIGRERSYGVEVELHGRLIDVETSEVLASAIVRARVDATESEFAGVRRGNIDKQAIEELAVQRAIDRLARRLSELVPAKTSSP